jgi:hypothetical protein
MVYQPTAKAGKALKQQHWDKPRPYSIVARILRRGGLYALPTDNRQNPVIYSGGEVDL